MWVLQECTHAVACPVVHVGTRTFSLAEFASIWAEEVSTATFAAVHWANAHIQSLYQAWLGRYEASNAQRPLLDRVRDTFHRKCKDPHDKIYALLSLIPDHEAKQLAPNYQVDMPQLVNNAVAVMLKTPNWKLEQVRAFVRNIERHASPTNAYSHSIASNDQGKLAAPMWLYGLSTKVFQHIRDSLIGEGALIVYADCIEDATRRQRWKDPLEPELEDDMQRLHIRLVETRHSLELSSSTAWSSMTLVDLPDPLDPWRSGHKAPECELFTTKHDIEGIAVATTIAEGGFAPGDRLIFSPLSQVAWITRRGHIRAACLLLPRSCTDLAEDQAELWPTQPVQVYDDGGPLDLETVDWQAWASGEHQRYHEDKNTRKFSKLMDEAKGQW